MSRPDPAEEMDFATSAVDMRASDQIQFANFPRAVSISMTLEPGEMLYLPVGWAHFVEALSPALTINYWHSRAFSRSLWTDEA